MTQKMRGHSGKKIVRKSRNSCRVNGRGCACIGTVDSRRNFAQSYNQIQTLKEFLFCHIYCAHHCSRLSAIVTWSCAVSNTESRYPRSGTDSGWLGRGDDKFVLLKLSFQSTLWGQVCNFVLVPGKTSWLIMSSLYTVLPKNRPLLYQAVIATSSLGNELKEKIAETAKFHRKGK